MMQMTGQVHIVLVEEEGGRRLTWLEAENFVFVIFKKSKYITSEFSRVSFWLCYWIVLNISGKFLPLQNVHKRQRKVKKLKLAAANRGVALCKVIADQEESAGLSGKVQVQASKSSSKNWQKINHDIGLEIRMFASFLILLTFELQGLRINTLYKAYLVSISPIVLNWLYL